MKTFMENFLNSKPTEFFLSVIKKLPNKWQEVIQNNSEYTIDLNEFIVMNELYVGKTEIIQDSTQYIYIYIYIYI